MRDAARPLFGGLLVGASLGLVALGAHRPAEQGAAVAIIAAAVAALLVALIVGLAVARPWWGLVAWLAAAPIVNVARAELWLGGIQLIPSTFVVLALVAGVALDGRAHTARVPWLPLATAAALAIAASAVAPAPVAAASITLHGVLEPLAVFAIVVALRPDTARTLQALVALAAGVALATVVNLVWLVLLVAPADLYQQRMQLARLTFFSVGIYASMLVVAMPTVAGLQALRPPSARPGVVRAVAWGVIGLFVVALFLTFTKSAWLSAALACAVLILLLVRAWRARLALLLAVAAVLAVGVPYPLPVLRATLPAVASAYESFVRGLQGSARLESWDPDTYQGSGSIGIRLDAIGAAAEMVAGSPWLGVGPGGFAREFPAVRPDASVPELQSAHNLLPNLAAEYGLPFALLVAAGLAWLVAAGVAHARRAAGEQRVAAGVVVAALIGFLAMATLFGVDLYRSYRTMNTDVVVAAVLAGLAWCLVSAPAAAPPADRAAG